MNYSNIKNFDCANGSGVRVSLFVSGCHMNPKCKGCFNSVAWNFNYGQKFTDETMDYLIELLSNKHIRGLSILGGDPLAPQNISTVLYIVLNVREKFPDKDIWLWTGENFSDLYMLLYLYQKRMLNFDNLEYAINLRMLLYNIDVITTGRFIEDKKDLTRKWSGSSNQYTLRSSVFEDLNLDIDDDENIIIPKKYILEDGD